MICVIPSYFFVDFFFAHNSKGVPLGILDLQIFFNFFAHSLPRNMKLCTFRTISEYETLSSLKARNRDYYWMSRVLRETVELFGYQPSEDTSYYTGISLVMAVPSFRIRLCAPISTSVHIEVATKFSTRSGMILEMKQGNVYFTHLKTFNCEWLSRYPEESERYTILFLSVYK